MLLSSHAGGTFFRGNRKTGSATSQTIATHLDVALPVPGGQDYLRSNNVPDRESRALPSSGFR